MTFMAMWISLYLRRHAVLFTLECVVRCFEFLWRWPPPMVVQMTSSHLLLQFAFLMSCVRVCCVHVSHKLGEGMSTSESNLTSQSWIARSQKRQNYVLHSFVTLCKANAIKIYLYLSHCLVAFGNCVSVWVQHLLWFPLVHISVAREKNRNEFAKASARKLLFYLVDTMTINPSLDALVSFTL